jgi:hypothetical protein
MDVNKINKVDVINYKLSAWSVSNAINSKVHLFFIYHPVGEINCIVNQKKIKCSIQYTTPKPETFLIEFH